MKAYGSGCIDPHFLDLGTSWRLVINFTPRPLWRLGDSRAGLEDLENIFYTNSDPLALQPVGSRDTD
jgi:hypothetical protein